MENVELIQRWVTTLGSRYTTWWLSVYDQAPWHIAIETSLIIFIIWVVVFKKQYNPRKQGYGGRAPAPLTSKEKQQLIDEWEPVPLVARDEEAEQRWSQRVTVSAILSAKEVLLEGDDTPKLNCTNLDFLGLGATQETRDVALATLEEYSLGSCGPRGFYGTTRKHADLEESIAAFMGTPEAIAYSDSVSTVASAVPAFLKRGDLVILDAGANHALQTGCLLSRSKVHTFKHNDMEDLERVIKQVVRKNAAVSATQRRFIVIEGLYKHTGDIAPLDVIAALKDKYKIRIMCDETLSWGVLGATGKGLSEHFNLPVLTEDVIVASLATTLGSIGGFCVGSREVTDHQRLAGAGYCFSASAPPFLCATASSALKRMTPELLTTLRERSAQLHAGLSAFNKFSVVSDVNSPVAHAALQVEGQTAEEANEMLDAIVRKCLENDVLISRGEYLADNKQQGAPALRVHVNAAMSEEDVQLAIDTVAAAANEVVGGVTQSRGRGRKAKAAKGKTPAKRKTTKRASSKRRSAAKQRDEDEDEDTKAEAEEEATTLRRSSRRRKPRVVS